MKANVNQQLINSLTKHLYIEIEVVLFPWNISTLYLLVQRHFMACKWFCRLGFVVVDVGGCYKLCFNWFPPADDEQRSMKIATISEAEIWISIFHRPRWVEPITITRWMMNNRGFCLIHNQKGLVTLWLIDHPTLSNCRSGIIFRYKNAFSSDWFGLNTCVSLHENKRAIYFRMRRAQRLVSNCHSTALALLLPPPISRQG